MSPTPKKPLRMSKTAFKKLITDLESAIQDGCQLASADASKVGDKSGHAAKCRASSDEISDLISDLPQPNAKILTKTDRTTRYNIIQRANDCLHALDLAISEFDDPDPGDFEPTPRPHIEETRGASVSHESHDSERGPRTTGTDWDLQLQHERLKLEMERLKLDKEKAELELERERLRQGSAGQPDANAGTNPIPTGRGSGPASGTRSSVKLPKLEIPKFYGDVLQFSAFWDSFSASIHANPSLSEVEKFTYLRAQLSEGALSAVEGLSVTGANYPIAVDILKTRFGKKPRIIAAHYSALKDLQKCVDSTESLRSFVDGVEGHLRSLEGLGESTNQMYLVSLIQSRLPRGVLQKLEESLDDDDWTVELLRKKLQKLVSTREAVESKLGDDNEFSAVPFRSSTEALNINTQRNSSGTGTRGKQQRIGRYSRGQEGNYPKPKPQGWGAGRQSPRANPPGSRGNRGQGQRPKHCVMCENSTHWTDECRNFPSLQERLGKIKGRCHICLRSDHMKSNCRLAATKLCFYCKQPGHHSSLCAKQFSGRTQTSLTESQSTNVETQNSSNHSGTFLATGKRVPLQTATVVIQNPITKQTFKTRLLLDTGSQSSYITKGLARDLGLVSQRQETLNLTTFASQQPRVLNSAVFSVTLLLKYGDALTVNAHEVEHITTNLHSISPDILQHSDEGLWRDKLADDITASHQLPIQMLIGNDLYWDIVTAKRLTLQPGLYLIWSKQGWIFGGQLSGGLHSQGEVTMLSSFLTQTDRKLPVGSNWGPPDTELEPKLHSDLKGLWDLDSLGIKDFSESPDDQKALEHFKNTVIYEKGRYWVTLPWKDDKPNLPTNYQLALGRLGGLVKRLKRDSESFQKYDNIIREQLANGIIEEVTAGTQGGDLKHYIPHHAVITPQKSTTKVRIVYDGSAKTKPSNPSINDCLYRGPVILEDLAGLLMRFRMHKVGLIADIEKAFLQVGIQIPDRDALRFLWLRNLSGPVDGHNLLVLRFANVPFGLNCSPFLLAASVDDFMVRKGDPISEKVRKNIYVDNIVTSLPSAREAAEFYGATKQIFAQISMNLREWTSNDPDFMRSLPNVDRVDSNPVKVLGLEWDHKQDTLGIVGPRSDSNATTKRDILKVVSAVYDPLSLFAPLVLPAKILMQKLWQEGYEWDDPLPQDILTEWNQVKGYLDSIPQGKIPRFVGLPNPIDIQLHCFCDASSDAYGISIYLRVQSLEEVVSNLIFAKARVAPKRILTIPRLELMAALIGARGLKFVTKELHVDISKTVLWSDSQCVLHWLNSPKDVGRFVDNRVAEIRAACPISFRYIHTQENPADLASRGSSFPEDFLQAAFWWHGPPWLILNPNQWPNLPLPELSPQNVERILDKKSTSKVSVHQFHVAVGEPRLHRIKNFGLDPAKFSRLKKLLNVTAYVLRFVHNLKPGSAKRNGKLSLAEVQEATNVWDKLVQAESFLGVQEALVQRKPHPLVKQLGLRLHGDGLIRCHGRMGNAELLESALFPKLLPRNHPYTHLVIKNKHQKLFHSGVSHTLAELRNEYWVIQGRSAVKSVLRSCLICRRWEGKPYRAPEMPAFPKKRVSQSAPFSYVGLDYFGPLFVKRGRQRVKVWACIFTCLVVRAIHLELVSDMTAEHFLLALQRFIARRGAPKEITSDNATHFKLVGKALGPPKDERLEQFLIDTRISWKFITERAPWMGGFYERLISLVKRSLKKTVGPLCLTADQLNTLLVQIEACVNSRPVTFVGDELNSALCPADFLCLNAKSSGTPVDPSYELSNDIAGTSTGRNLLEMWKKGQQHLNSFWDIWRNEYLLALRERQQMELKQPKSTIPVVPKTGDVVLISDQLPRSQWRLGQIEEVFPDAYGVVRSANVKVASGKTFKRAIKMLFPLEIPNDG